jgi:ectoine hydroxylase-related dioxygenase (phytanoyl-CoA dioxygenase family)
MSTLADVDIGDLADRFGREGFVHVRGAIPADEIARYGEAVDEAVARRARLDTRRLDEKSAYEQSFIQCQYLWEDSPAVRPLTFHPTIGRLAAALLQAPMVRLWHDQALYKEAGGRETEAHQDHPYWPIGGRDALTAWIPLARVDDQSGCMGYFPGSHLGEAEFVDIFTSPGAGKALETRQRTAPVWVPCEPGDVIFHHGLTAHLAKPNSSEQTRRVYTAIYFKDGARRAGPRPHPSVDRDGIADGAVIEGAATPVVWPRTAGWWPAPGAWPRREAKWMQRAVRLGIFPDQPTP